MKREDASDGVFVDGFLRGSFTKTLTLNDSGTPLADQKPASVFNIGTVTLPEGVLGPPADHSVFINGPD